MNRTIGATGTLLRETKGEVVLVSRLRAALERLNAALPPEAFTTAVDELTRDRSAMSLEAPNRAVYLLLKRHKYACARYGFVTPSRPSPRSRRRGRREWASPA